VIADYIIEPTVESGILQGAADVIALDAKKEADLLPDAARADVLMVWHILMWSDRILRKFRKCKGIVRCGVGYDNVDLEAAGRLGMYVCNVPDYGVEEVADHALTLMLCLIRNVDRFNHDVKRGSWSWTWTIPVPRTSKLTVGIVGLGRIGTAVALRVKALGCEVVAYDPYVPDGKDKSVGVKSVDLPTLLSISDVVSIHTPLTSETRHMFNKDVLGRMKKSAILINTSRGAIIDENALYEALSQKKIAAAGLDVLETEPCKPNNPLLKLDNIIITPHAAFYSVDSLHELRNKASLEVLRILKGEKPRNPVNLEYLKA
jgi:lactate dehydrogenase-like 2-hydroxyacid dehydrogenase